MAGYEIREGYEFFGEAAMLPENCEVLHKGLTYLIRKMIMRDYRSIEIRQWSGRKHSILNVYTEIFLNGQNWAFESKYDTGCPPEGMTVEHVVERIIGSSGLNFVEFNDPVFGGKASLITSPLSLNRLIHSYLEELIYLIASGSSFVENKES